MFRPKFGEHLLLEIVGSIGDGLFVVMQVGAQDGIGRGYPLGFVVDNLPILVGLTHVMSV